MKKHLQYKNSYKIWNPIEMIDYVMIDIGFRPKHLYKLNIVLEWWAHNIGYYITLHFTDCKKLERINRRCKDVDLFVDVKE